ncbi:MAG: histidinol phosphate phosphatase domain-containing protein [Deltaproteobacteria bacterium]|nr:histidinol phosphate phosphatase domain-containing protein [Deltaproteobacteria bacterium]
MIDLHTHSLFSDGELVPTELARRFEVAGYRALAITDHGDLSNLELIIPQLVVFCEGINRQGGIKVIPGIELTHVHPATIPELVSRSRDLGAKLILVHGESIVEPVAPGTNRMAIEACADILAHPGLITEEEVLLAKEYSVYLELTSRKGHSLTNGHVARLAQRIGASLVLNSDAHAPGDIWPAARLQEIVLGAGLMEEDFQKMMENAGQIVERCLTSGR